MRIDQSSGIWENYGDKTDVVSEKNNQPQETIEKSNTKEKTTFVSMRSFQHNEENDIYDLDVEIRENAPFTPEELGSSKNRVCSACACDTVGCYGTNSCASRCGGTHCYC